MVKRWTVKNKAKKLSFLRREPQQDSSKANVMRLVKNGQEVAGEFLHVCRASREVGYVKMKDMQQQCGSSWKITNSDGAHTTLLRKLPLESHDVANTVGYAAEGEVVVAEFLFVVPKGEKRGGYIKLRHLRPIDDSPDAGVPVASQWPPSLQVWAVMDSNHDGAWLRIQPHADNTRANVVCLIPNGDKVAGDFLCVRRISGEAGFVKFKDLRVLRADGKAWRVRSAKGAATTPLRREPAESLDATNVVAQLTEGERLDGEYVFVIHKDGERKGYVKRRYLTALAPA
mmetsp:Transcript_62072/g.176330  ORF Transcript_62072/g.176330 Transcript_62072/m.176330 type:complete len:286 (-) Transcript_62072:227-1084(-)